MNKYIKWGVWGILALLLLGMLLGGEQSEKETQNEKKNNEEKNTNDAKEKKHKKKEINKTPNTFCEFPTFTKDKRGQPLKTKDEGNVNDILIGLFGADPTNFHPVGGIGDPFVTKEGNSFRMWFTGSKDGETEQLGTAYSESADGILWSDPKHEKEHIQLILEPSTTGFDSHGIETVTIAKNLKTNEYHLYYTGNLLPSPNVYHQIGLATSTDGKTWKKHPTPVMKESLTWDKPIATDELTVGGVLEPTVLYENDMFKMWYAGFGVYEEAEGFSQIGYATSTDGKTWKKNPTPVLTTGKKGAWDDSYVSHTHVIADPEKGYHLFYAGGESSSGDTMRIGHAYSEDGKTWKKNPKNPIIEGTKNTWDAGMVGGPSALFVEDTLYVYYMGSKEPNFADAIYFGLATGSCV